MAARFSMKCLAMALVAVVVPLTAEAQTGGISGWTIERSEAADLWYHAMAVIGFRAPDGLPRYSSEYADHIRAIKSERGIPPTQLDDLGEDLRDAFEQDAAFQVFHTLPLHFATASTDQLFVGLEFVVLEGFGNADALEANTRAAADRILPLFVAPRQRRILQVFLQTLQDERERFYADYWQSDVAQGSDDLSTVRDRWKRDIEPAVDTFLQSQGLESGIVLVSPALTSGGVLHTSTPQGNVAAVGFRTGEMGARQTAHSILKRLCSRVADEAMESPGVEGSQEAWANASVRCGELVLRREAPVVADDYAAAFVAMLGAGQGGTLEDAYPIDEALEEALLRLTAPDAAAQAAAQEADKPQRPSGGWIFEPRANTDLWYHALAVIAADQPGPLGLYSADYANHIREVKRDLGVYPTRLDSLTSELNALATGGGDRDLIHFVPVHFPTMDVVEMLNALRTPRHTEVVRAFGRQLDSWTHDAIRQLAEVMLNEWQVFYKDYWRTQVSENRARYSAVQQYWDRVLGPILTPYLEERNLHGGLVMPSLPVGPEGRVIDPDPFDGNDQVVAMWFPLTAHKAEASNFFFLKELCFLIISDNAYGRFGRGTQDFDDLRRTGAVRCGAMILDEFSPVLALHYRRTFLDAVGAEESATMEAFERVYYLDPSILARLEAQVTLPR